MSLHYAFSSINLEIYAQAFISKAYDLQKLINTSPQKFEKLTSQLSMKKGQTIRLKNLIESLKPIYRSGDIPTIDQTSQKIILDLPTKRPRSETMVIEKDIDSVVKSLTSDLSGIVEQRNTLRDVLQEIAQVELGYYEHTIEEMKKLKSQVMAFIMNK